MDTDQHQFDYPISIITRPKRRDDLRVHKLESRSNISVPTLKEICVEVMSHNVFVLLIEQDSQSILICAPYERSQNFSFNMVYVQEKLHPHPIPPTASGILEVGNLTQQIYWNPMSCL